MNSIKVKMQSMVDEKEYAKRRLEETETEAEELSNNNTKLDEANKASAASELEVGGLQRRINLTETELEQMESRLKEITEQLTTASHNSDKSEHGRKTLEVQGIDDDEK